jgi:hypothetical protein
MLARSVAQVLGRGSSVITIITSVDLAFTLFLYLLNVASSLKVTVYVLQDRTSVYRIFYEYLLGKYANDLLIALGTVLWLTLSVGGRLRPLTLGIYGSLVLIAILSNFQVLLDITALVSIPLISSLFLCNRLTSNIRVKSGFNSLVTNYLLTLGIVMASLSLFIYFFGALSISMGPFRFKDYGYILFILFSSLSPVLLLLLVFSLPIKLLTKRLLTKISKIETALTPSKLKTKKKILYISLFMGLSTFLAFIPHQASLTNDTHMIGADSRNYVRDVNRLERSEDIQDLLKQVFVVMHGGDRPLSFFFLLLTTKIFPYEHSFIIDRLPLFLSPATVLVLFFLTRELTRSDITSLLASFLTVGSFQTLVGTYAGFYANWIALIIGYLSIIYAFKYLKKPSPLPLVIYSILIVVMLFCHVYTWTILTIVTIIFLGVALKMNYYRRRSVLFLLLIVFGSVAVDLSRMAFTGSAGGVEQDIRVAQQQQAGLKQFDQRWYNILSTTQFHYGSLFGNSIFFALGLYWLLKSKTEEPWNIFLLIFFSVGIIPLFFGDWVVQSRVFYNIPFQIPAAIALTFLVSTKRTGPMIVVAVGIWLISFSVRAVLNF